MAGEPLEVEHVFGATGGQGVLRLKGPLTAENLADFQNAVRRENAPTMIFVKISDFFERIWIVLRDSKPIIRENGARSDSSVQIG